MPWTRLIALAGLVIAAFVLGGIAQEARRPTVFDAADRAVAVAARSEEMVKQLQEEMKGFRLKASDFYLKDIVGDPQDTRWQGCDGNDVLISAACTNSKQAQTSVGPTFRLQDGKREARCQRYSTGTSGRRPDDLLEVEVVRCAASLPRCCRSAGTDAAAESEAGPLGQTICLA